MLADDLRDRLGLEPTKVGVVVVDHGSRRAESNDLLDDVVALFRRASGIPIVEAAHMELAPPSIAEAFDACVSAGAETVVVFPYFLSPGRHWSQDIPRLAAEAASKHPRVAWQVTSPLGLHDLMAEVIGQRVLQCMHRSLRDAPPCDLCAAEGGCQMHGSPRA